MMLVRSCDFYIGYVKARSKKNNSQCIFEVNEEIIHCCSIIEIELQGCQHFKLTKEWTSNKIQQVPVCQILF